MRTELVVDERDRLLTLDELAVTRTPDLQHLTLDH